MKNFVDELNSITEKSTQKKESGRQKAAAFAAMQDKQARLWAKTMIDIYRYVNNSSENKYLKLPTTSGNTRPEELDIDNLKGKYYYLWRECEAIGLKPRVRYAWDGGGMEDWYNFWVEW